ncbi:hypothetical protein LTR28_011223 [Elasticomyces elasticus]|nr:hypothetical protein LTR28_011223 [Elasticomyces elasticus]
MATAEIAPRPQDRRRRQPFTTWVKRLVKPDSKKTGIPLASRPKKGNNPYPESGHLYKHSPASSGNDHLSFSTPPTHRRNDSYTSDTPEEPSNSNRSAAPTVATNRETIHSDAGQSKALTATTAGGALSSNDGAGADSTFSSPNHSQHSLTTTLTTIQSTAPANALNQASSTGAPSQAPSNSHAPALTTQTPATFSHQYPVSPGGSISAIPAHLQPAANPTTYQSATAHNLLTDNASILTLASSSKRRRRHSLDTDASVRALAPSSVWGGSRESLPLSVLSGNADHGAAYGSAGVGAVVAAAGVSGVSSPGGLYQASQSRPSIGGIASAERASIYSNQGAAALGERQSERNSYVKV